MPESDLNAAREFVTGVMRGEITPETRPGAFDEDMVSFNTYLLENEDPVWLLQQIADTRHSLSGRTHILLELRNLYDQALTILKREDPDIGDLNRSTWQ